VIGDESEGGDCDEVICAWWGEPGGQWTEWGWQNEEGSWNSSGFKLRSSHSRTYAENWRILNSTLKILRHNMLLLNT